MWKSMQVCSKLKYLDVFKRSISGGFWFFTPREQLPFRRLFSSEARVEVHQYHIELHETAALSSFNFSFIWLRDHCRCDKCYNHVTHQRNFNIALLPHALPPKQCMSEEDNIKIIWADGHHSNYSIHWLKENSHSRSQISKDILWNNENVKSQKIEHIDMQTFMNAEQGLKSLLTSLVNYGVGFVENVPPTLQATQKVVERICHVQRTFFGDMWEFSDSMDHEDTAYTKDALGAHTDHTYFSEASGLQVFHCLHHDGTGGETLLVDGFNAANQLKLKYPESYERLTSHIIESEYRETGRHYLTANNVLIKCPLTNNLKQIRFNTYDRAILRTISSTEVSQFYEDYLKLSTIIADSNSEWWFKLHAGTVLLFNNWRILHGRAAYTGHRKIAGCYIGHSDWHSKARVLGLLEDNSEILNT